MVLFSTDEDNNNAGYSLNIGAKLIRLVIMYMKLPQNSFQTMLKELLGSQTDLTIVIVCIQVDANEKNHCHRSGTVPGRMITQPVVRCYKALKALRKWRENLKSQDE